jgi:hypothetical protein
VDDAARLAQRALSLSRGHRERAHEAWGLRLLGEVHGAGDRADLAAARTAFGQAITLGEALGMRPLVAHCRLGLGKLERRVGDRAAADAALAAAADFRSMDMRLWLAEVEGASSG